MLLNKKNFKKSFIRKNLKKKIVFIKRKKIYFKNFFKNVFTDIQKSKLLKNRIFGPYKNKEVFDIFFKLICLIPVKKINLINRVLRIFSYLKIHLRNLMFLRISKLYKLYYRSYLKNLIQKTSGKVLLAKQFLFKFSSSFYHLHLNKNSKTGLLFLQYPNTIKKRKFTVLNFVSFNRNLEDFSFYKSFFLANRRLNWKLMLWRKLTKKEINLKKSTRKWIFVFPFLITIKPCTIIIKNIFFKTFFIISKWLKRRSSKKKEARFLFGKTIEKVFSNSEYSLYITAKRNRNITLNNYVTYGGYFIWYTLSKYYYSLKFDNKFFFPVKKKGLPLLKKSIYIRKHNYFLRDQYKISTKMYWKFFGFYKRQWSSSFIGFSFFLRLYNLYFFWFLYFFNKLFYYFNKIVFGLWFRFFYFMNLSKSLNDSLLFYNYKLLYKHMDVNYYHQGSYFEFENILLIFLIKFDNILFKYNNFISFNKIFYKYYFLLMFIFFYKNYFLLNIYYNYNKYLMNIRYKTFKIDNAFFDMLYKENYTYKTVRNVDYRSVKKRLDFKYEGYFTVDKRKYKKMSNLKKLNYVQLTKKRQACLFLK